MYVKECSHSYSYKSMNEIIVKSRRVTILLIFLSCAAAAAAPAIQAVLKYCSPSTRELVSVQLYRFTVPDTEFHSSFVLDRYLFTTLHFLERKTWPSLGVHILFMNSNHISVCHFNR